MHTDTAKLLPIARCACLLAAAVTALAGWPGAATAAFLSLALCCFANLSAVCLSNTSAQMAGFAGGVCAQYEVYIFT